MNKRRLAIMTAKDIMNPRVEALHPETPIGDAVVWLIRRGYSGAPVLGDNGKILGVLSEGDCIRALIAMAEEHTPQGRVVDYMTREVEEVSEDDPVIEIAGHFESAHVRRLVVVKDGHLAGLISRRDLMHALEAYAARRKLPTTYDLLNKAWR